MPAGLFNKGRVVMNQKIVEFLAGVESGYVVRYRGGLGYLSEGGGIATDAQDSLFFPANDPSGQCNYIRAYDSASVAASHWNAEVVRAIKLNGVVRAVE